MSAVHGHCQLCDKATTLTWVVVSIDGRKNDKAKLICADCNVKQPADKPKGVVEK